MSYQLLANGGVRRLADFALIPASTDNRDWRDYLVWLDAGNTPAPVDPPTPQEEASALTAAGLQVTCASNAGLDGTYAIDAEARSNIGDIFSSVAGGLGFPLDAPTLPYGDLSGVPHDFTEAEFKAFAKAVRDYVFQVNAALGIKLAGGVADWPAQPVAVVVQGEG